jgi:hypothetical protein
MVYNTQNYWVSGLCPSFGILNNTKSRNPVILIFVLLCALTSRHELGYLRRYSDGLLTGRPAFDLWPGQGFFFFLQRPDRLWVAPTRLCSGLWKRFPRG